MGKAGNRSHNSIQQWKICLKKREEQKTEPKDTRQKKGPSKKLLCFGQPKKKKA